MATDNKPTWKPQTQFVTFPSGQRARVKRIDVVSLILDGGNVPDNVIGFMLNGGNPTEMTGADASALLKAMNQALRATFISPAIVDEPDYENDQISIFDVELADKMWYWQWLMTGTEVGNVARFPQEQGGNGSVAPESEIIREVTK